MSKRKNVTPSQTPEKVQQVQELRRSGATRWYKGGTRATENNRAIKEHDHADHY